jgi:hypothetical protein
MKLIMIIDNDNCATSKNIIVKSTTFPHCNIHKCTWMSPDGKTHNQIDDILNFECNIILLLLIPFYSLKVFFNSKDSS